MDPVAAGVVELARGLIDIDSTSGREAAATDWLAGRLRERGYHVTQQPVVDDRVNVIATVGLADPEIVLSTHIDCVPPFFPSRVEGDALFGRGACDAKGILAAEISALDRLRAAGEERVGLLVVVGEEHGSHGARAANRLSNRCRYLINGEPTDNRLAAATKGAYRVRLSASGRAGHSAYPKLGDSAVDKLLDARPKLPYGARGKGFGDEPPQPGVIRGVQIQECSILHVVVVALGVGKAPVVNQNVLHIFVPGQRPGLD